MSTVPSWLAAFFGFFAAMIVMMFVGRVARYMLELRAVGASENKAPMPWPRVTVLAILHPAGLFFTAILVTSIYAVCVRKLVAAAWFFGVMFATIALTWSFTIHVIRSKAKRVPNGEGTRA